MGLAMFWPAMSGAEPPAHSYNPLPSLPMSPEPAIPMEPAALLARSDRISPNIFSAAITSKYPGLLTRRAAHPSISMVS